tara:strand:- start:799 stop:1092 length:294 start_codon:yes stop_codon:yes gene_type:complete
MKKKKSYINILDHLYEITTKNIQDFIKTIPKENNENIQLLEEYIQIIMMDKVNFEKSQEIPDFADDDLSDLNYTFEKNTIDSYISDVNAKNERHKKV